MEFTNKHLKINFLNYKKKKGGWKTPVNLNKINFEVQTKQRALRRQKAQTWVFLLGEMGVQED